MTYRRARLLAVVLAVLVGRDTVRLPRHQYLRFDVHAKTFTVCNVCVLHLDGHHLEANTLILDGWIVP